MDLHPVDTLIEEHLIIRAVLDAMDREMTRVRSGAQLRQEFWLRVAEFVQDFVNGRHHVKEEELLLPYMLGCGRSEDVPPVAGMKHEHVEGRVIVQCLRDAVQQSNTEQILDACRAYIDLLREHMESEESTVFQMARGMLGADQVRRLDADFARIEEGTDDGHVRGWHVELAQWICTEAGVQFG